MGETQLFIIPGQPLCRMYLSYDCNYVCEKKIAIKHTFSEHKTPYCRALSMTGAVAEFGSKECAGRSYPWPCM